MDGRITKAQISRIWAAAHEMGLDRETLYLLVPRGSISTLTRAEASDLIRHLSGGVPGGSTATEGQSLDRMAEFRATESQKSFINSLFRQLGWEDEPQRIRGFLRKFAHVDSVEALNDRGRAIALIEALKAMTARQHRTPSRN